MTSGPETARLAHEPGIDGLSGTAEPTLAVAAARQATSEPGVRSTDLPAEQAAPPRGDDQSIPYRLVFEHAPEGIVITDARRRIVAVNPAYTELTGCAMAGGAGHLPAILSADTRHGAGYRTIWRAVRHSGRWQGEVDCHTSAGEARTQRLTIRTLGDAPGRVTHYAAFFSDIAERKAEQDRINFLAQHDALTGLANRHLLDDRLGQALAGAHRQGGQVALLFLDLDRFKVINDSLGHKVGDALLCSVAARLKSQLRQEDTVARHGGDEFVFVIPHFDRPDMPAHVAQKLITAMSEPFDIEGEHFSIGASVGISLYPGDAGDGEKLIRNADSAMYKAKARGGNCYEFYTRNMTSRAIERMILENSLRGGLARDEFVIFYQPQVNLGSGRVAGVEALVRWSHPKLGVLPPDKFITVAEETGMIVEIGDWVLRGACRQNKQWQQRGLPPIPISVNVSARQCKQDLTSLVRRALDESQLDPRYLELELTEGTLMADVGELLHELKSMGVSLSIDDFGTGYSSLSYLKRFPIDNLKIDKSLISELGVGDRNSSIAGAAVSLAHSLGLTVTAEGAHAAWQVRYLHERGCDLVQGYYFGRPLVANKFAAMLRRRKTARIGPGYVGAHGANLAAAAPLH
jgi:diguanylate cyclase (GGDEF)-like protein/PAS domain S-box-containing protein